LFTINGSGRWTSWSSAGGAVVEERRPDGGRQTYRNERSSTHRLLLYLCPFEQLVRVEHGSRPAVARIPRYRSVRPRSA
jgi:hypothetical protein